MNSVDEEWSKYLSGDFEEYVNEKDDNIKSENNSIITENIIDSETSKIPRCEDLYISTKTKVLFLNTNIDINDIFWKIPIIEYSTQSNGIIKKQMKVVSKTPEEYEILKERLKNIPYYNENIIKQIHNPDARRIKFKDERKITIGLSKKDIMNSRSKVKNAFYNCFAIIFRFLFEGSFKEIHVKIFNTGKLEIPGILNKNILSLVKSMIIDLLNSILPSNNIDFIEHTSDNNVLINSNFNCGFFINRDLLHSILKNKYSIDTAFDPCSYPGVKCKYYFNNSLGFDIKTQNGCIDQNDFNMTITQLIESKKYTEVSFMIFRTGSCLIIGNCSEDILLFIYDFIKNVLQTEYHTIAVHNETPIVKNKEKKIKKKTIIFN